MSKVTFLPIPSNPKFANLSGVVFGRLFVLGLYEKKGRHYKWFCSCLCGKTKAVETSSLVCGHTKSCGCLQKERASASRTIHGHNRPGARTPEYTSFNLAKSRCTNRNDPGYSNYGGRGIRFLFDSFQEFFDHVGPKPSRSHSLERKDNEGNYEIGNVEWALRYKQSRNKRTNVFITYDGVTLCREDWGERTGLSSGTILSRLEVGWCIACSLTVRPYGPRCKHRG